MPSFGLAEWQLLIHQPPQCSSPMLVEEPSGGSKRALSLYTFSFWPKWRMQSNCHTLFPQLKREMGYWQLSIAQNLNGRKVGGTKGRWFSEATQGSAQWRKQDKGSLQSLKNHSHIRGTGSGIFILFICWLLVLIVHIYYLIIYHHYHYYNDDNNDDGVLPAWMFVTQVPVLPSEARKEDWLPGTWS